MNVVLEWFQGWDSTGWAAITGLGTLVLAIASIIQGRHTKAQIDISNKNAEAAESQALIAREQTDLTRSSVDAAVEVHRQSMRARVDQEAPRVTVYFDAPSNPRADVHRSGPPGANGLRMLSPESFSQSRDAAGEEFILPRDQNTFLWFTGRGMLVNEGQSSARVRLPSEAKFLAGPSIFAPSEEIDLPPMAAPTPGTEAVLPPGQKALFKWAEGKPLRDWIEGQENHGSPIHQESIWMWFVVFDPRGIGAIDTLSAHFKPDVLSPITNLDSHWKVGEPGSYGIVHVTEMHRGYTHEGAQTENLTVRNNYFGIGHSD